MKTLKEQYIELFAKWINESDQENLEELYEELKYMWWYEIIEAGVFGDVDYWASDPGWSDDPVKVQYNEDCLYEAINELKLPHEIVQM